MFSLVLFAALATASPSPSPTEPPEILHVVVSPFCGMLRQTIAPVTEVQRANDRSFTDFYGQAAKLNDDVFRTDGLGVDIELEMTTIAHRSQYNSGVVDTSISRAERLLAASRKRYPDEKYPDLAALRNEMESVLDSQQRYNSVLSAITGAYIDGLGVVNVPQDIPQLNYVNGMREVLGAPPIPRLPRPGDTEQSLAQLRNELRTGSADSDPNDPTDLSDPTNLRKHLIAQEAQSWNATVAAIDVCKKREGNGTH